MPATVYVGPGEMPVGGPATSSSRRAISAPAEALAVLALQQRAFDKQAAANTTSLSGCWTARAKTSSPAILKRTLVVPDFWNDRLAVSSLILAKAVTPLKAPLAPAQQIEHPYTLGQTEVVPVAAPSFSTDEALSVVFQMSNYGAPDTDLTVDYAFYRMDGPRRLFNRTDAQVFSDEDLPPPRAWDTQAFAMQTVPLRPFPPGRYELEVIVKDRLTRATATGTVAFTVVSGVR